MFLTKFKNMAGFSVWSMIIVIVVFHSTHAEEPQCSKYDFLEKLLEKVIRMEINFETLRKELLSSLDTISAEMKSTKDNVDKSLAIAAEERAKIKGEQSALENNLIAGCEAKTKTLDETLSQQQSTINRMSEDFRKLENETTNNIGTEKPNIAFRAAMASGKSVSPVQTLVYPEVVVDTANVYDPSTGHFTAPLNGTYLFTVQTCIQSSKTVVINIIVDNRTYNMVVFRDNASSVCFTATDIVLLGKGMNVWVTCAAGGSSWVMFQNDAHRRNMFAGVLM